jgi:hypothetical protein
MGMGTIAKGNVHLSFLFWQNLVFVQNLRSLELVVDLDFMDCVIKRAFATH